MIVIVTNFTVWVYAQSIDDYIQNIKNVSLDLNKNNLSPLDNFSLTVSTIKTEGNNWIPVFGDKIDVEPENNYYFISHFELNEYAVQSHIVISGYNKSSNTWSQILQCPRGTDGPIKSEICLSFYFTKGYQSDSAYFSVRLV